MNPVVMEIAGGSVLVDAEDYPKIAHIRWIAHPNGCGNVYARGVISRKPKQKMVYMHRLLMNPSPGEFIDHRDGNGLNNCRSNLRIATRSENQRNRRVGYKNQTGFKGVEKAGPGFCARLQLGYERVYLGYFDTAIEAARAYNGEAIKQFGEFACLNYIGAEDA